MSSPTLAFSFSHPHRVSPRHLVDLLGGKGANLAEMTSVLRLKVPPGFTLGTDVSRMVARGGWQAQIDEAVETQLCAIEATTQKQFGGASDPLLVSVRSGAPRSMPGMLDTILNVGLNDVTVEGLAVATSDSRFAFDSYRRLISMFGEIVLGIEPRLFESELSAEVAATGANSEAMLDAYSLRRLCGRFLKGIEAQGLSFPQDARQQLRQAIGAIFASWHNDRAAAYRRREGIGEDSGTAVNVQAMVFGNLGPCSGSGVVFTRNPATGEPEPYGDFLTNAQGEDVVAGTHATADLSHVAKDIPGVYDELLAVLRRLEVHYKDMCDVEFTVERGKLWILQTRVGKRTPSAAARIAFDMAEEGLISRADALLRVHPNVVELDRGRLDTSARPVATGLPASPGTAAGRVYFTAEAALEAVSRGESVVLWRAETSPADIRGMQVATGIVTKFGGLTSHAAVVARSWAIPAIVGVTDLAFGMDFCVISGEVIHEGEIVSLDGTTGVVVRGDVRRPDPAEFPAEVEMLLCWADEIRGDQGMGATSSSALSIDDGAVTAKARLLAAQALIRCETLGASTTDSTVAGVSHRPNPGSQLNSTDTFFVMHALLIKGSAQSSAIADMTGMHNSTVEEMLASAASEGLVRERQGLLAGWMLTDAGKVRHAHALSELRQSDAAMDLDRLYRSRFLQLNADFKLVCTDWQLRSGPYGRTADNTHEINDHSDAAYDNAVIERLASIHEIATGLIGHAAAIAGWFSPYSGRLQLALDAVRGGDMDRFTKPLRRSYHDVWMELHQDFVIILGIDRATEESRSVDS